MPQISEALASANTLGLDRLDAQLLLLHSIGKSSRERAWLMAHDKDEMLATDMAAYLGLAQRRLTGEPVAYLTGHKEFFGLTLQVDARVLVPRPDTETLVDWALALLAADNPARTVDSGGAVLDLGTGSGAVALAIKHERPVAQVSAVDFSTVALEVAQANAHRLKLDVAFSQGDWLDGVQACFDLILSNPPYVAAGDPHLAALTHEPRTALASGQDGLDDIRKIIGQASAHLNPGGWLLLEHGYDQAVQVRNLLTAAGFAQVQSRRDLAGIERCSGGENPNANKDMGRWPT